MTVPKSEEFRPIQNPYIVGNPIKDPKMFFGREDDFAYVNKKFSGDKEGGMIVLCGARRSGKTSILFQILNGRIGEDFMPVLIDMQSMAIRDDSDLLDKLATEIVAAIGHAGIVIEEYRPKAGDNPFTAFEQLVKKINLIMGEKKLILMFDEYELFETNIDSGIISAKILNLLANLIEHKRVFIVFTGSDNLEARNKPYWGVFLSKALHQRISFLSKGDTLRLVRQPVEGIVHYDGGIPERIYNLTAGQPFYTQVICQSIIDHLNEYRRYAVGADDVDQVVSEIIENPLPQMIFSWNALSNLEKLTLAIIAELTKEAQRPIVAGAIIEYAEQAGIGYRIDPAELNKTLESLFHGDVLRKESSADAYGFKMDIWRLWIARMHSVWQVIDEMERSGGDQGDRGIESEMLAKRRKIRGIAVAASALGVVIIVGAAALVMRGSGGNSPIEQDFAILTVRTDPPRANVLVDGEPKGESPINAARLLAGERILRVEREGYVPVLDTLSLAKNAQDTVFYDLVGLTGGIRIESAPAGATISIDGSPTGLQTPDTVSGLSVNAPHRIALALAGYQGVSRDGIYVLADSVVTRSFALSKESGSLTIRSEPSDADAYLDGIYRGKTPQVANGLYYGSHTLRISKDGFRSETIEFEMSRPHEEKSVSLATLPPGEIVFSIKPYASIWIDGALIREGAQSLSVKRPPGRYRVELRYPNKPPYITEIEVKPNEAVTVRHTF